MARLHTLSSLVCIADVKVDAPQLAGLVHSLDLKLQGRPGLGLCTRHLQLLPGLHSAPSASAAAEPWQSRPWSTAPGWPTHRLFCLKDSACTVFQAGTLMEPASQG